ncbi:unnamed protein product [Chondrus crispus]|uniref:Uncharacterized protein n=1 Tax=Chondrus crispus TaxID=2769 RepID=R7QSD2_CHOCR|nr:unnamed protein product [Chondrus crispus]CDF41009.1 unnamed protein product [Chondrus crispus]|eukprot:XP_005711303.1 unnamed protein product [Chondrus crispus]
MLEWQRYTNSVSKSTIDLQSCRDDKSQLDIKTKSVLAPNLNTEISCQIRSLFLVCRHFWSRCAMYVDLCCVTLCLATLKVSNTLCLNIMAPLL